MRPNLQTRPNFWPRLGTSAESPALPGACLANWPADRLQGFLARANLPHANGSALLKEKDPEVFFHGLLQVARSLEGKNALPEAVELYSALGAKDPEDNRVPKAVREAALVRLQAIAGSGKTGARFEFFASHFLSDASSPELLIGMTAANMASGLTRIWLRPSYRFASHMFAFGAEAVTFPLATRFAAQALGRKPNPGLHGLSGEIASSFLLLGAMRLTGTLVGWGLPRRMGRNGRAMFQQAAMFGGILAGQELQRRFDLAPASADATRVTDALALLLHSQVGGHLSGKIMGRPWGMAGREFSGRPRGPRAMLESILSQAVPVPAKAGVLAPMPLWMSIGKPPIPGLSWISNLPTEVRIRIKDSSPPSSPTKALNANQVGELEKVAKDIPISLERVEALARLGFHARQGGSQATMFFQEAEKIVDKLATPMEKSIALGRIGLEMHRSGNAPGALSFFQGSFREAGRIKKSFFSRETLFPSHWRDYLQWVAELHATPELKALAAQALAMAQEIRRRVPSLGHDELLTHQVVLRLARLGNHGEALELSQTMGSSDLALESRIRLARILLENGNRAGARDILTILEGAVDVAGLRSDLAVDYLRTSQYTQFRREWALLQSPFHQINCLLNGAQLYRNRADTLSSILMTLEAEKLLAENLASLSLLKRARLQGHLARLLGKNPERELGDPYLRNSIDFINSVFQPGQKMTLDANRALTEIFLAGADRYGETYIDSLLDISHPDDRVEILRRMSLRFNEEGKLGHALLWAHRIKGEARAWLHKDLALAQLHSGNSWIALDLAKKIQDPVARYQALLHIYLHQEGPPPGSPSNPPLPGGGFTPVGNPKLNARSLGNDQAPIHQDSAPLKPDENLIASVPWYLLASQKILAPSAAPLFLHLDGSASPGSVPSPGLYSASAPVGSGSGGASPSSDPPPNSRGFTEEARAWVEEQGFGEAELKLVEGLMDKIYRQMWSILNFHSGSGLAHRLATGKLITVRIIPQDQSLNNYSLELLDSPKALQTEFNMVQWTFDPANGSLTPQDFLGHLPFEINAAEKNIDVRRFFVPFYRRIDLTLPGLNASNLEVALPQEIQKLAAQDPTIHKAPTFLKKAPEAPLASPDSPAPESQESPPLLVSYRPLIFEGSRIEVDRYAEYQELPETGRKRLQRLVQHVLAALHARESQIDLPENQVLKFSPGVHIIIGPNPDAPEKKQVEVLTMKEAFARQRKKPLGKDEVLLVLLRYTEMGGENYNYPHLEQHFTSPLDPQGFPTGADLEFQKSLGLKGPLHLRLEFLNLRPENLQEWDQWMAKNGYLEGTNRETVN